MIKISRWAPDGGLKKENPFRGEGIPLKGSGHFRNKGELSETGHRKGRLQGRPWTLGQAGGKEVRKKTCPMCVPNERTPAMLKEPLQGQSRFIQLRHGTGSREKASTRKGQKFRKSGSTEVYTGVIGPGKET